MNILLSGFSFDAIGGLEIVSAALAKMLVAAGHQVQCAALHGIGCCEKDGYRIVGIAPTNRIARSVAHRLPFLHPLGKVRELAAWADVIIAAHCHTLPQVYSAIAKLPKRPPVVAWLHGREVWGSQGESYATALRRADRLMAVSHYTSRQVASLLGPEHTPTVVFNPVDTGLFRPLSPEDCVDRHSILTVGRLGHDTEHKGYDMLLKAMAILQRRRPELPLTLRIAGSGSRLPVLQSFANQLNISDRVQFTGPLSKTELVDHYRRCDLFAFPSRVVPSGSEWHGEGFGVVNIEAAACGRPVLTSTHGGCPETIVAGVTGLLVDPMREEAIADGIESMFERGPQERDRMGEQGRKFVTETFSYAAVSERIQTLLGEVVADRPPPRAPGGSGA